MTTSALDAYEARHMAAGEFVVRCPGGDVRHEDTFASVGAAEEWLADDHGCLPGARHQIVQAETLDRLLARAAGR